MAAISTCVGAVHSTIYIALATIYAVFPVVQSYFYVQLSYLSNGPHFLFCPPWGQWNQTDYASDCVNCGYRQWALQLL